jgi:hypothetical protein
VANQDAEDRNRALGEQHRRPEQKKEEQHAYVAILAPNSLKPTNFAASSLAPPMCTQTRRNGRRAETASPMDFMPSSPAKSSADSGHLTCQPHLRAALFWAAAG